MLLLQQSHRHLFHRSLIDGSVPGEVFQVSPVVDHVQRGHFLGDGVLLVAYPP
jgi:hypothetical protein